MVENETEIRKGKIIVPNKKIEDVIILDNGEYLENGNIPNHDKIEIIYLSDPDK